MPRVLAIRTFPDPVLRKISAPVKKIDPSLKRFIERLEEIMRGQPGGIGIAAPQVGVLKQVAVVDVSSKVPGAETLILINPQIIKRSSDQMFREGCMSVPHYTANVLRSCEIVLGWRDINFRFLERRFSGLEAICVQHEVDHLNGMLFLDRVGCLNSDVFRRKRYL